MSHDFLWLHLRDLPYFRATLRSIEARMMSEVELEPPVLDVGSGDGHFASVFSEAEVEVGVDPAFKPTMEAKRRGVYKLLVQAEGAITPFPPAYFGSAFSNSVLEHVDNLDPVLAEISRVLKPGARLAFTVPNPGYRTKLSLPRTLSGLGLQGLSKAYEAWFMRVTRTKNLLDEQEWGDRLKRAGMRLEHSLRYFSPAALRTLEWGHYFGSVCLLPRWLTGKWILAPTRWNLWLTDRLVRRYYEEQPSDEGTYTFFLARKR